MVPGFSNGWTHRDAGSVRRQIGSGPGIGRRGPVGGGADRYSGSGPGPGSAFRGAHRNLGIDAPPLPHSGDRRIIHGHRRRTGRPARQLQPSPGRPGCRRNRGRRPRLRGHPDRGRDRRRGPLSGHLQPGLGRGPARRGGPRPGAKGGPPGPATGGRLVPWGHHPATGTRGVSP